MLLHPNTIWQRSYTLLVRGYSTMQRQHAFDLIMMAREGKRTLKHVGNGSFEIESRTRPGTIYHVDLPKHTCECEQAQKHLPCVHVATAQLIAWS